MLSALLYLKLTSIRNWFRQRLRRLRRPKYLVGAIVGVAYFWAFFFRPMFAHDDPGAPAAVPLPAEARAVLPALAAVILAGVGLLICWILPEGRPGLGFSEAEVAFLFPAPVTRRGLIHYRLIGVQLGLLFTALFFTFVSRFWGFLGGNFVIHAAGWWVILATLNLHTTGAGFVIGRLLDRGLSASRRRWWILATAGLVLGFNLALVWPSLRVPEVENLASLSAFAGYLGPMLEHGVLPWLLLPARLVVAPFLAPDGGAFLRALGPALLVLALHYGWVLWAETPFEEASLAQAEKRGARLAAFRAGGGVAALRAAPKVRRDPFRLAAGGRPEVAFWWKNLLSTGSYFNLRVFAGCAACLVAGGLWLDRQPDLVPVRGMVAMAAGGFGGYVLLLGPSLARQDLRSDLGRVDLLKSYPLRGWQVVLGEMLTPVSILTGLFWLALLAAALTFAPPAKFDLPLGLRLATAASLAALAPALCALQLLVPNAATLLFPSWAPGPRTRSGGGIDVMGQRLIFVFGQMLVMFLALLPAGLVAFGVYVVVRFIAGPVPAVLLSAPPVLAILLAELAAGLWWLGGRFEKLDLSADLQP